MKKCPYCGKEYPDDISHCSIDGELLPGGETLAANVPPIAPDLTLPLSAAENAIPISIQPSERRLVITEAVLVCIIAFGNYIFFAIRMLLDGGTGSRAKSSADWAFEAFRQAAVVALVWLLLLRRGKSFSGLGLSWQLKDLGRSIVLWVGGLIAFSIVYHGLYHSGLIGTASFFPRERVSHALFNGGIYPTTFLFQFVNPFFEELIVRAYLMTVIRDLTQSTMKAVIVSTVLQSSYHLYQGGPAALSLGAVFLIFSLYYARTNRIAPVILAHLFEDVTATLWHAFN